MAGVKTIFLVSILFLSLLDVSGAPVGTAFTYQGRLTAGGAPANGDYDLQFTLRDAPTAGNAVGSPIATAPVTVSNGLFTVSLDFGAGVFNGTALWLDIGVRTNGSVAAYALLTPRQSLTATPFAVQAQNATTAATAGSATSLSGPLSLAQLPAAVVTNNATGLNLSGTFSGNGAGLANVPGAVAWQSVAGATQTAAPNSGYLLNNATQTVVTLPTAANLGDVVRITGAGAGGWAVTPNSGQGILTPWIARDSNRAWRSVASSADGTKLVAVDGDSYIYTSTNSGVTWTGHNVSGANGFSWKSVASSADGSKLVAIDPGYYGFFSGTYYSGPVCTSADSGATWQTRSYFNHLNAITTSADGNILLAATYGGRLFTSYDAGATWTGRENSRFWASVAYGGTMVAADNGGQIYTSYDYGQSWTARDSNRNWNAVAASSDGSKLVASVSSGQIYTSTDYGQHWTARPAAGSRNWYSVASSADGGKLVGVVYSGQIYTSADSGTNWTVQAGAGNRYWYSVASSADGNKLVAVETSGQIYTSAGVLSGSAGTTAGLQYLGFGEWLPLAESQIASGAVGPSQIADGAVGNAQIASGVSINGNFSGDGSALNGLWNLGGNYGTTPGTHFLGTGDNQALEFKVNYSRALRLEPTADSPNLIGGFPDNLVTNGFYGATIAGGGTSGAANIAGANYAAIGGGSQNSVSGIAATIPGGTGNTASGDYSFAAGRRAKANHPGSFVWGDSTDADFSSAFNNQFLIRAAFVGIGRATQISSAEYFGIQTPNTNAGSFGGMYINTAGSAAKPFYGYALAGGAGAYHYLDGNDGNKWKLNVGGGDRIIVTTAGLVGIGITLPTEKLHVGGNILASGSITGASLSALGEARINDNDLKLRAGTDANHGLGWYGSTRQFASQSPDGPVLYGYQGGILATKNGGDNWSLKWDTSGNITTRGTVNPPSDRNVKTNFTAINPLEVLEKVSAMPVTTWEYKDSEGTKHLGPVAQDFHAAFGLGTDDKHISTVDADGVALAAIQGLNQKLETQVKTKQAQIESLEKRLADLEKLVQSIAK